ncbi:N-acetyltransferase family protein [Dickeya chrysanthemi]|uniref:GNAT family N-acetyltransferase n=1 Tax=Dickeya TaxID=204037 RepID=UPI0003A65366|nr:MULTISPECIES: GNAT family N-acetyltransferase [Dickeya]TYL44263.1 N-acetyltransferase [Dickeya sp. ws52]WJM86400.1 N-acetyltransferase family protein [Dickeya chrysanthemi]
MSTIVIEDARAEHIAAIRDIYAQHVLHGIATFETEAPEEAEMRDRWRKIRDAGLPWLVATENGHVLGYCYLGFYRTRYAYRFTLEDSIYLHPDHLGKGVGKRLLSAALLQAEQQGYRQVVSVIADSGNQASLQLHLSLGFTLTGTLRSVGMKHGRWVDTTLLQRALGEGDASLPYD